MEKKSTDKNVAHVQSVERALLLMELLAKENREISLTEISKSLGWPKSTVHGIIATLRDYSFVDQSSATGKYRLGVRFFEFGNLVSRSWNIRDVAMPHMQKLNHLTGETVQLGKDDGGEVLYLEKLESTHVLRIVSEAGARLPMHCSGLGKVLLAFKTPAERKGIISKQGLRAMTPNTITNKAALEKELENVRQKGYAIDNQEIMMGLCCVAAPIYDKSGCVNYAISISGMQSSIQGVHFDGILAALQKSAADISFAMGYRP